MKMEGLWIRTPLCIISRESCLLMPSQLPQHEHDQEKRVSDRGVVVG